ncbi:hypothetical protein [Streptomyces sp. NPDC048508]|uniref:hypothetical protein n=1 Tax=Streptomyces sp. NPDC048508 TaxID=3365561 RepID=UPI0037182E71
MGGALTAIFPGGHDVSIADEIVHYLHRGDVRASCVSAVGRTPSNPAYRKCGRTDSTWRLVRGG